MVLNLSTSSLKWDFMRDFICSAVAMAYNGNDNIK
jgi:hypothetical protein